MVSTSPATAARFVGQSVHRKEDKRLVTGHGQYVDDVQWPGTVHAAFVRSNVASGRIVSIDTTEAEALPGVLGVFTAETINALHGEAWHGMLGPAMAVPAPLAVGGVKHVGDPVVLVVAVSRYVAEDACDLVIVDIDPTPAVVDYATAAANHDDLVHRDWGLETNAMVEMPFMPMSADLEECFAASAHVVEATIVQNRYNAVPMEARGILVRFDTGRDELEIVTSNQSSHETRNFFARYFSLPEANISVTMRDVGGGFGQKMFMFREECAVAIAAKLLGQPVKWIEDRTSWPAPTVATSRPRCASPSTKTAPSRPSPASTSPTLAPTPSARRR